MADDVNSSEPDAAVTALQHTTEAVNAKASFLAEWLSDWAEEQVWLPGWLQQPLVVTILLGGMLLVAWLVYAVFRPLILRWMKGLVQKTDNTLDDQLFGYGMFRWLTHLLPALVIFLVSPGLLESVPTLASILTKAATLYLLVAGFFTVDSGINAVRAILDKSSMTARFNLAIATQVIKLVVGLFFLILFIAVIMGKSPTVLLGGIGVIASVLMLVFKDVILGFVAGIQLSGNQMLSEGDWLEMPSHNADGDVEEIGLTTVKVRNFDKTITTIPTYALISSPFKNWRGMQESGGRRIKRSLLIDTNSVQLCSDEMLDRFREIEHIADYLKRKREEVSEFNAKLSPEQDKNRVNGRRLTNVGTFRAYIEGYLRHHPDINQDMTIIVRQLAPEGQGLPIEIYCFSANKDWAAYESIQADIFDHLLAVAREFDLRVFQQPTGLDFHKLGE